MIKENQRIIIGLFFVAFFFTGIVVFDDYGLSWDEGHQRDLGTTAAKYIVRGDQKFLQHRDKYYGTIFEVSLVAIEATLNLSKNPRIVYFMRHLITFLLFYIGVFFFYLLCKHRFNRWEIGLMGSLFLIFSPRIFAHSFYNSKDIPFLAIFIIAIYTLIWYLNNKTTFRVVLLALVSAILIAMRIPGIVLPLFFTIFLVGDWLLIKSEKLKGQKVIGHCLIYIVLLILFTIIFWPILWNNPFFHFIKAFQEMSHYPWPGSVLYWGRYIKAINLPWHYIPVWIAISTPLLYSFYFIVGCFVSVTELIMKPLQFYAAHRDDYIFILWFFFPLVAIIIFKSVLYDGWRHVFFIYPAFLMFSLIGLTTLFKYIKLKFHGRSRQIIYSILILITVLSLINTAKFMVEHHPFQNVYFNPLVSRDMKEAKKNFELDYWGLSYRRALEYILRNDKNKVIKIYVTNRPGKVNANILTPKDRERLIYVKNPNEAKYFLSNFRGHKEDYPYKEYYSIKINEAKIMAVYKTN